jgi:hypothetical protein
VVKMATKTSKRTIEGMVDDLRDLTPKAAEWKILRDEDNGYGLYERVEGDNLRLLLDLGDSAPEAASTLNGVRFAISTM